MAATYSSSAAGGGTSGTSNRTASITPAAGTTLVVFCMVSVNTNNAPTCSDNRGGTYDLIAVAQTNAGANRLSAFIRKAFCDNVSHTVTVATGSNTAGEIVLIAVAGLEFLGSDAVRQSAVQDNGGRGTTPAPAFSSSALTGNMTLGAVGNGTNPATLTTPGSWTERQDVGQSTPSTGLEVVTRDSGFTGTTVTWGSTSGSVYGAIIVELNGELAPFFGQAWM